MADHVDFDSILHRPIAPGNEFAKLIPKPKGKKILIGKGDTAFSIEKMVETVNQYSHELEAVAKQLQSSSLTDSIDNVKDFIYNHFQYKADQADQLLRTPAHAWHLDRFDGIDCKSYSILASCLFTEMGIAHYIRKIKQPGFAPTEYTHVYVVVPVDQDTGKLQNGYYTVDGTLQDDYEPAFTEKSDYFMLNHYRLNAPANGLGLSIGSFSLDNLSSIKSLISSIQCWGGSSYDGDALKKVSVKIEAYYNGLISKINNAVVNQDDQAFAEAVNEFFGNSKMFVASQEKNLTKGWNPCTSSAIKANIKIFKFYRDTVGAALTAWLNDNFTKDLLVQGTPVIFTNVGAETKYGFRHLNYSPAVTISEPLFYYDPKPKTVKAFQITQYVADVLDDNLTFDPLQFVSGLSTVLASFGNSQTGQNPTNPTTGQTNTLNNGNQPNTAGGSVFGWLIAGAGLMLLFNGIKNAKDEPATTTKRRTNVRRK